MCGNLTEGWLSLVIGPFDNNARRMTRKKARAAFRMTLALLTQARLALYVFFLTNLTQYGM